jgi:hypothetical protein
LDPSDVVFKVLVLIQANISRAKIRVSSLVSDCEFIMQSVTRLARALFEIAVDKNYSIQVSRCLQVAQMVEQQAWSDRQPLLQFKELEVKGYRALDVLQKISIDELQEMSERDLLDLVRNRHLANRVHHFCKAFPKVDLDVTVKPITEGVIRIQVLISANYSWDTSIHGNVQHYYAWVEDPTHDSIYHFESFVIAKKVVVAKEPVELIFTVPLLKPHSMEYFVTVVNSKYMRKLIGSRVVALIVVGYRHGHFVPHRLGQVEHVAELHHSDEVFEREAPPEDGSAQRRVRTVVRFHAFQRCAESGVPLLLQCRF